ncbi:glyoxylate/hydroxypyruvate reductase A [Rhodobacterales bacterium FZCC0188]|jgi:glyoxylate/hydroxypyruvate reductase A|nr:glyoxylate/hydroxypyruvate reductase A [Rhodobacterales bacterium FZCC0188]
MPSPTILFAAKSEKWAEYEPALRKALQKTGVDATGLTTEADPAEVDYIIYAPNSGLQDFTPFTRAKAVLSLWAGVEDIVGNKTITMPLARMVDYGLTQGMLEFVTGHVLRYHLMIDDFLAGQDGVWRPNLVPPLARDRKVTILGLGVLGAAAAQSLARIGFDVAGWSRSPKSIEGIACYHGEAGLFDALRHAEILVTLLPDTAATRGLINQTTLAALPHGAKIINPGRGSLIEDATLLAALDTGKIAAATLDVFTIEPLPASHPYWRHPRVTVTPHIASATRAETASETIAENIRRGEVSEPFLHLVDRAAGY